MKRSLSPIYLDEKGVEPVPSVISRKQKKRIVFGWYGEE